ncbi:MAG: tetraacyldisaccharide 4'-kinase [Rhodoferax sp.]
MRQALSRALMRAWTGKGLLAVAMLPVAALYGALAALRRQLYRWNLLQSQAVPASVIVVGNVVAGGSGKTPTVIGLVRHLQAQGWRVGVVSRGFGRKTQDCQEVTANSTAEEAGDEPLLIQRASGAPVFVGRQRRQAAMALLAAHPDTEVIVCDDGLQHYGLARDLEVCVFDDRGCGNGWLLPAGLLREPWPRRAVASAGQSADRLLVLRTGGPALAGEFGARRALTAFATDRHGNARPLRELTAPGKPPVHAVAGIARPGLFFTMLRQEGVPLAHTQALPDHDSFAHFQPPDPQAAQLLCTEKDASKLWRVAPEAMFVALEQTIEPAFFATVDKHLAAHRATLAPRRL